MCKCKPKVREPFCGRPGCERPKIQRNLSTPEARAFWEGVEKSAAYVRTQPAWMRAGINVCPTNFDYSGITQYQCSLGGCRACQAAVDRGEA